mgnify:CR=1 FL=1
MKKGLLAALAIIITGLLGYWYEHTAIGKTPTVDSNEQQLSIYHYECDEHVMMDIAMTNNMSFLMISAANGGVYPSNETLSQVDSDLGARFEGGGFVLHGLGESVTLSQGDQSLNCSPVPNPDEAPFNFGD